MTTLSAFTILQSIIVPVPTLNVIAYVRGSSIEQNESILIESMKNKCIKMRMYLLTK